MSEACRVPVTRSPSTRRPGRSPGRCRCGRGPRGPPPSASSATVPEVASSRIQPSRFRAWSPSIPATSTCEPSRSSTSRRGAPPPAPCSTAGPRTPSAEIVSPRPSMRIGWPGRTISSTRSRRGLAPGAGWAVRPAEAGLPLVYQQLDLLALGDSRAASARRAPARPRGRRAARRPLPTTPASPDRPRGSGPGGGGRQPAAAGRGRRRRGRG